MKKVILFIFCILLAGCSADEDKQKVELTISAAASLQDALNEIKKQFEKENPTVTLTYNFGSSGTLQQQISQGAPVDLFFSAAVDKFEILKKEGLISKNVDLVGNEIVLIVPKHSPLQINSFKDLKKAKKVAIGTPETVPAGKYAKEMLITENLWQDIQSRIVPSKDVRQVLAYVETENVDAGIVYHTDALTSNKVRIVVAANEGTHIPIVYPLGIIKDSMNKKEVKLFYHFLQEEKAMSIFKKYGFKGLN